MVYLDEEGDAIALYPYGSFDQKNYSFREYFTKPRDTKKQYISSVFQAQVDSEGRYVVAISTPVFDTKGKFVGEIIGSLDLRKLGTQTQEIVVEKDGEYFVLYDANMKTIYHPDSKKVGIEATEEDKAALADTIKNVTRIDFVDGRTGILASEHLEMLGWSIVLRAPISSAFSLTSQATLSIFGLVLFVLLCSALFLLYFRVRVCDIREEGP